MSEKKPRKSFNKLDKTFRFPGGFTADEKRRAQRIYEGLKNKHPKTSSHVLWDTSINFVIDTSKDNFINVD